MKTHSNLRIFGASTLLSVAVLVATIFGIGWAALVTCLILVIIEITFSFDNAIVNAKVLERLSPAWQTAFLTIGIIIAVFLVRLVLPVIIVALGAGLHFGQVVDLALHHPETYADKLELAHPLIASFGGAFLATLALTFFIHEKTEVVWWAHFERGLKKLKFVWIAPVFVTLTVATLAFYLNDLQVLVAGLIGVASYVAIHLLTVLLAKDQPKGQHLAGWAGFGLFIYLQILDASFSLDGVVGAFAITNEVLLIAIGLGIGALWVRTLTIYMVRRGTLGEYIYLEHGAYYTIAVLATSMFVSLFVNVPDAATGLASVAIIGLAIMGSIKAKKITSKEHAQLTE